MEPYGPTEQQDMGLFTFYRQQAQRQKQLKFKHKSDSLNKILNKASQNIENQKKNKLQQILKQRIPQSSRTSQKLRQITEEQAVPIIKRNQLKISKSILEVDVAFGPEKNIKHTQSTQRKTPKDQKDEQIGNYKQFSRYLSQLDALKAKKKHKVNHQNSFQEYKPTSQGYIKKKRDYNQVQKIKVSFQFKKTALQPQQFGLNELSKNSVPISLHKKQKTALKAYRKQKHKAQTQIRKTDQSTEKKTQSNHKVPVGILEGLLRLNENHKSKKLIRVQKISVNSSIHQKTPKKNEMKSQSLPRLKKDLPDINPKGKLETSHLAMSLQLQKIHQLKSRYQIRAIQRQDQSILNLNQKMRNDIKKTKNITEHQLRHYVSMRSSQIQQKSGNDWQKSAKNLLKVMQEKSNCREKQNDLIENYKREDLGFKKHKEIFCKRDQYLKSYKDKLKRNIFGIEKLEQSKIKYMMEQKKKQIIQSLLGKLNLL